MPYDSNQRWIPPDDNWRTGKYFRVRLSGATGKQKYLEEVSAAEADGTMEGGRQWSWDDLFNLQHGYTIEDDNIPQDYEADLKHMIEKGLLSDLFHTQYDDDGKIDADKTLDSMFNTSQWNQASGQMRYEILGQFQDYYHGDDGITKFSDDLREDPNWGLDIQREWEIDAKSQSEWETKDSKKVFQQLMGLTEDGTYLNEYFELGSKADFRYANKKDKVVLNSMRQHVFGDNYHQKYSTVEEIRKARIAYSQQTVQERERLAKWASKYITPYQDHEENKEDHEAWEFHKSMKFDPETDTMTYYDSIAGHAKVDINGNPVTHTIQPPAEPKVMDIRVGDTVQKLYDSDGNRIVNESSVNELYHRYLGRASDKTGLDYWVNAGHSFDAVEKYLQDSPEGQANKSNWLDPKDKLYFNPQKYGSPESIKARMRAEPAKITAPTITIRNIGQPKKPTNLPSHWLTEAPVKVPAVTSGDTT